MIYPYKYGTIIFFVFFLIDGIDANAYIKISAINILNENRVQKNSLKLGIEKIGKRNVPNRFFLIAKTIK